jgi:UDP-N-acetylglucosamine--N-acetylmuramyl-(pentapeptide) pyrophosphoryl-undecaprenol N-acetylglucosamine transferase
MVVGNPVRAGFAHPPEREAACHLLGLDPVLPVVLVCGGSQGARTLNNAVTEALPSFRADEIQFIWMTGNADVAQARAAGEKAAAAVQASAFIDDMVTACAAADLIVSRAGASSTAEIAMLAKPTILVPYPFATDNHQEQNARAFETAGAAIVLLDSECTGERLLSEIRGLLADRNRLAQMSAGAASLAKPGAAETIVENILSLVFEEAH